MQPQFPPGDPIAKMMDIRHIRRKNQRDLPRLLSYMLDESPAIVQAARESLFALRPMASLTERWIDDTALDRCQHSIIPDWLWDMCKGWGKPGDFVDLCIRTAVALNTEKCEQFLGQMAAFPGMDRMFINRLKQRNLSRLAASFKNQVTDLRSRQFPKQLTLAPTLACQLTCDYCVSAGAHHQRNRDMPLSTALKILDWAQLHGVERIAFSGGEPTLYRHFLPLIGKISENGFTFFLATNGLGSKNTMTAIAAARPLCVTLHLTPQVLASESIGTYKRNATALIKKGIYAVMRCNFSDPGQTITPYFDIAEKTEMREIRAAIPIPNANRHNQYVDRVALQNFSILLDRFVTEGKRRGIVTKLAKPFFPCKLSRETAQHFFSNGSMATNCPVHLQEFSNNLTVYPDGSFIPCLGLSMNSHTNILSFPGISDAARIFKRRLSALLKEPLLEECSVCPLWKGSRCVGACLSYRLPTRHTDMRTDGE